MTLNDNFIRYSYVKDGGQIYPDTIWYTGSGTTDGVFSVIFVREERSDVRSSYATAFKVTTNYRISEIRTGNNGTWARKYDFGYTTRSNGTSSLLSTVTVSGRDTSGAVTTLRNTTFTYQTASTSWTQDTSWTIPEWFLDGGSDTGLRLLDYNGDGRIHPIQIPLRV